MGIKKLKRVFILNYGYKEVRLPDPAAEYTVDQVRNHFAKTYPSIITAKISTSIDKRSDDYLYTFDIKVGRLEMMFKKSIRNVIKIFKKKMVNRRDEVYK